jgi:hypothetical protein
MDDIKELRQIIKQAIRQLEELDILYGDTLITDVVERIEDLRTTLNSAFQERISEK